MTGRPDGAAAAEEDECARNAQGEIECVGIHTPAKAAAELLTKDRRDKFILVASPIPNFHTDNYSIDNPRTQVRQKAEES